MSHQLPLHWRTESLLSTRLFSHLCPLKTIQETLPDPNHMDGLVLPNDLLLLIGEQLSQHADRWNLLLVCRHFHDLYLPLLYRHVELRNWRHINSFFHAITNKPSLARAVRTLDWNDWNSAIKPPSKQESQDLKASNVINSHLWAYSVDEIEAAVWQRDLVNGLADAWIAVTLPLMAHLRQLHLSIDRNTPHLSRVIQRVINDEHPFHGRHTFQHLQKVSLDLSHDMDEHAYSNTEYGLLFSSSDIVMPIFQLPSLREFFAIGLVDPTPTSPKMSNNSNNTALSSITAIDLRESCGNYGMEKFISSCVALKSFKYQHSDSRLQSLGYRPNEFYRALTRSKKTLEVLWLDNHGSHHPFTAAGLNQTHEQFFGSFAEFSVLRELRIRLTNLLDIEFQNEPTTPLLDCLPSSLNSLFIEGCKMRHMSMLAAQIRAVIKSRHMRFPNLQRIEIEGNFHDRSRSGIEETNDCIPENTSEVPLVTLPLYLDCVTAGFDLKFRKSPFS